MCSIREELTKRNNISSRCKYSVSRYLNFAFLYCKSLVFPKDINLTFSGLIIENQIFNSNLLSSDGLLFTGYKDVVAQLFDLRVDSY